MSRIPAFGQFPRDGGKEKPSPPDSRGAVDMHFKLLFQQLPADCFFYETGWL